MIFISVAQNEYLGCLRRFLTIGVAFCSSKLLEFFPTKKLARLLAADWSFFTSLIDKPRIQGRRWRKTLALLPLCWMKPRSTAQLLP